MAFQPDAEIFIELPRTLNCGVKSSPLSLLGVGLKSWRSELPGWRLAVGFQLLAIDSFFSFQRSGVRVVSY
ncbi:hypothetical protein L0128_10245 [candidate division KSB1 bacterium]|nr:hypothetical protein [candidate division KSB1 bacterium]